MGKVHVKMGRVGEEKKGVRYCTVYCTIGVSKVGENTTPEGD